jgi:predicted RND superfamily exporter protein
MDSIFNIALLIFALVVLPATWYYTKKSGKLPKKSEPFISDLEKTRKEKTQNDALSIASLIVILLLIIVLTKFGMI